MNTRYLSLSEKVKWDSFVHASPQYTIFSTSWFLDHFDHKYKILVAEDNEQILGGIVLVQDSLKYYSNPLFVKYLGVLVKGFEGKKQTRSNNSHKVITALSNELASYRSFLYNFSPYYTNWLPFYWKGFSQQVVYTYRLDLTKGMDLIQAGYSKNRKWLIKKAKRDSLVVREATPEELYQCITATFDSQGGKPPLSYVSLLKFFELKENFFSLCVSDEQGEVSAACGVLYDPTCAYFIFNGVMSDSGAGNTFLLHSAIKKSIGLSNFFDFEGSMLPQVERLYRSMGGEQTPYYKIWCPSFRNFAKKMLISQYKKIFLSKKKHA